MRLIKKLWRLAFWSKFKSYNPSVMGGCTPVFNREDTRYKRVTPSEMAQELSKLKAPTESGERARLGIIEELGKK